MRRFHNYREGPYYGLFQALLTMRWPSQWLWNFKLCEGSFPALPVSGRVSAGGGGAASRGSSRQGGAGPRRWGRSWTGHPSPWSLRKCLHVINACSALIHNTFIHFFLLFSCLAKRTMSKLWFSLQFPKEFLFVNVIIFIDVVAFKTLLFLLFCICIIQSWNSSFTEIYRLKSKYLLWQCLIFIVYLHIWFKFGNSIMPLFLLVGNFWYSPTKTLPSLSLSRAFTTFVQ